ncbi:hypothetical protein LSCM4_03784 [Leishmania orientalis]|uniref:carbonic anhydrase n=1 Tax=Leishmania orientalis TaxID=2249476 RepID=A0A836HBE8_9TRYP|nr:hypothetical protein LSCM4_03784 [Leishmania orientalis]
MRTLPLCAALVVAQLVLFFSVSGAVSRLGEQPSYYEGNYGTSGVALYRFDESRASWSYSKPSDWPKLCLTGSRQSPISFMNLDATNVVTNASLRQLQLSSECVFPREVTQARIVNGGAVNTVTFESQGRSPEDLCECTVRDPLNGTRIYHFAGLDFNVVPVHRLHMLRPDVEMHIFFTTDDSEEENRELLTVAVMLEASATANSTSARALDHILVDGSLPPRHAMTTSFLTEDLPITSLIPERQSYLLYNGSYTHPPCTENVRWVVMTSPILISSVALGKLRDSVKEPTTNGFQRFGNARQPQALNGRLIYRFDDRSVSANDTEGKSILDDAWSRHGDDMVNLSPGVLLDSVPAGSSCDSSHNSESSSHVLAAPFLSDSGLLPENGAVRPSSSPTTLSVGSNNESSSHVAAKPGTETPSPTLVPFASEADGEKPSSVSDSSRVGSDAAEGSNSAPHANASSSASAFDADESVHTESSFSASSAHLALNHSTPQPIEITTTTPTATNSSSSTAQNEGVGGGLSSTAGTGTGVAASIMSFAKNAWAFLKTVSVGAFQACVAYVKAYPMRAGLILLCILALIFLLRTCCRGWRRPVYVVGINPTELQPLNSANRFGRYGGTGTAAVRPAYDISA